MTLLAGDAFAFSAAVPATAAVKGAAAHARLTAAQATASAASTTAAPAMHDLVIWLVAHLTVPTADEVTIDGTAAEAAADTIAAETAAGGTRGLCGDFNLDGAVDDFDYALFLATFGRCSGDAAYDAAADTDADACITLVDYQAWLACYNAANGVTSPPDAEPAPAVGAETAPTSAASAR
jgi:hypothetical protein